MLMPNQSTIIMKVYLTDKQMRKLADKVKEKYPWTCRKNTIYTAELVSVWKVEITDKHAELIKEL